MLLESRQAFLDTPLFAVASFLFSEFCLQRSFFFYDAPKGTWLTDRRWSVPAWSASSSAFARRGQSTGASQHRPRQGDSLLGCPSLIGAELQAMD